MLKKLLTIGLVIFSLLGAGYASADLSDQVLDKANQTVHKLVALNSSCSVVMLAPERALTAGHCTNVINPVVVIGGVSYPVTEAYINPAVDLAILIIPEAPCPCADVGAPLLVNDPMFQIGYPGASSGYTGPVYSEGYLINKDEDFYGTLAVVTSAWAYPGMSGGGVFNMQGELIGIIVGGNAFFGTPSVYVEVTRIEMN